MKLEEFDFDLAKELIAQTPIEPRDSSRLLILDKIDSSLEEKVFRDILDYLWDDDVLVLNKTKVINARLKWLIKSDNESKNTECELFLHKQVDEKTWDCLIYPGKKLKPGKKVYFDFWDEKSVLSAEIKEVSDAGRIVEFDKSWLDFLDIIEKLWEIPLPPYIKEKLENSSRYQTVFSKDSGSVAAPTAGLHFTEELLEKLEKKWVKIEKVLLHVSLGTFKWVEVEDIQQHKMHSEYIELDEDVASRLNYYKKSWKRIIAVGTTSNRVLESFSDKNWLLSFGKRDTDIFIYPGYKWKFVDSLITNFHLPKSTLIMLVSALASKEAIKKAYDHAIKNKFRFFSFWDAMWIK